MLVEGCPMFPTQSTDLGNVPFSCHRRSPGWFGDVTST